MTAALFLKACQNQARTCNNKPDIRQPGKMYFGKLRATCSRTGWKRGAPHVDKKTEQRAKSGHNICSLSAGIGMDSVRSKPLPAWGRTYLKANHKLFLRRATMNLISKGFLRYFKTNLEAVWLLSYRLPKSSFAINLCTNYPTAISTGSNAFSTSFPSSKMSA